MENRGLSVWLRGDVIWCYIMDKDKKLSLRVFGLLSSSLLVFSQRFCRYVHRPTSDVCRTREPLRNFELRPLLNPRGSPVLIPSAMTSYIIVQHPLLLVGVTIALIQPTHGQGYNSDIPRPDAPAIYKGAFPILTARAGWRSIYNKVKWNANKRFQDLNSGCWFHSLKR